MDRRNNCIALANSRCTNLPLAVRVRTDPNWLLAVVNFVWQCLIKQQRIGNFIHLVYTDG